MVWEDGGVAELCVKDGVCVTKMCMKDGGVTELCVKDGV